jgi:hypothetical protein
LYGPQHIEEAVRAGDPTQPEFLLGSELNFHIPKCGSGYVDCHWRVTWTSLLK